MFKGYKTMAFGATVTVIPMLDMIFNTGFIQSFFSQFAWGEMAISGIGLAMMVLRYFTATPVGKQ